MRFLSYLKEPLYKATFGLLFFIIIYTFYNLEWIRSHIEDYAFDWVNNMVIAHQQQDTDSPYVFVFKVDQHYLRQQGLLNNDDRVNYGYVFPRDRIAAFIQQLDQHIASLGVHKPKALFVDYDLSYGSDSYGKLSESDQLLLNTLKQARDYVIVLPLVLKQNFIKDSSDPQIQALIKADKIRFVSVNFSVDNDGLSRRYRPYTADLPSATLTLWKLAQDQAVDLNQLKTQFQNRNIIENRVFFKFYHNLTQSNNDYESKQSFWGKLALLSANYPLAKIINEQFDNAIILLGADHDDSQDIFTVYNVLSNQDMSGLELHANALMTLFYLKGSLKKIDFKMGAVLVFGLFFIIHLFSDFIKRRYFPNHCYKQRWGNVLFFVSITVIMLLFSVLLLAYQIWFNWLIPVIILEFLEFIDFINYKYIQRDKL